MRLFTRTFSHCFIALTAMLAAFNASAKTQLNGLAVHTELGSEQFIAAVYSEQATTDARQLLLSGENKVMELRVVDARIYPRRFQRMWIEGMAINAGQRELEKHSEAMAEFGNLLNIRLRAGDVFRIERSADVGLTVSVNGIQLGLLKDVGLFDLLLRSWIGPVPLSSEFKAGLLAGGDVNTELRMRFAGIAPSEQRIAAIRQAVAANQARATSKEAVVAQAATPEPPEPTPSEEAPLPAIVPPQPPVAVTEDVVDDDESVFDESDVLLTVDATVLLAEQLYISQLTRRTGSFVTYPRLALRRNQEGTVRLNVVVSSDGVVKDVTVVERARFDALNRAAEDAIRSASPYPPIPAELALQEYQFNVPVVFRLQ